MSHPSWRHWLFCSVVMVLYCIDQRATFADTLEPRFQRNISFDLKPDERSYRVTGFDFSMTTQRLLVLLKNRTLPPELFFFSLVDGGVNIPRDLREFRTYGVDIRVSPNGELVAVAEVKRTRPKVNRVRIWDTTTRLFVSEFSTDAPPIHIDWHPDGSLMAVVTASRFVEIWNVLTGRKVRSIRASRTEFERPIDAAWSPDGRYIAIGTNGRRVYVELFRERRQSPALQPLNRHTVNFVQWSRNGQYLVAAGADINIWMNPQNALNFSKNYEHLMTLQNPRPGRPFARTLAWTSRGNHLAYGGKNSRFYIVDVESRRFNTFSPHPGSAVVETHWKDGTLITAGDWRDPTFKVWGFQ